MTVKLLTERHFEILSLKGDCTGLSESTLVKMSHCWKSCATAQMLALPFASVLRISVSLSEVIPNVSFLRYLINDLEVSMARKCHYHTLQTNPPHYEE